MLSKISQISLEKCMRWSLFLRKLQALRHANSFKKVFSTGIFLWNWQDFQALFFTEHFRWLVFKLSNSNILFKDFSGIPLRHSKSLVTCNPRNDKLNLKMYSLTKDFSVTRPGEAGFYVVRNKSAKRILNSWGFGGRCEPPSGSLRNIECLCKICKIS